MTTTSNVPSQFVIVYYRNFVYDPSSLIKFYDPSATIWRQSMTSSQGQSLEEAKELLAPEIPTGTDVRVLSFQACPIENGFSLNVIGSLTLEDQVKVLNQSFVLKEENGKYFVISDILNINEVANILPQTETAPQKNILKTQKFRQNKKLNDQFNHVPGRK